MRKRVLIFLSILLIIIFSALFFLNKNNYQTEKELKEKLVLFWGIGCPHCAKVEEFIKENGIKEKISFEEMEVYFDRKNQNILKEAARLCNLKTNEIGVPFLWDREKKECIIGDEPIINFFKEKLNL
jgi:glutaredoxin